MNRWRWLWTPLTAALLAAIVVSGPGAAELGSRIASLGSVDIALGMLGLWLSYALRAGRLFAEWRPRLHIDAIEALRVTLWHNAALNLLPLRAGELGYPWLLHRRWGVPPTVSAASLLWMRVQDAVLLAWAGAAVGVAVLFADRQLTAAGAALSVAAATALLLVVVVQGERWRACLRSIVLQRWPAPAGSRRVGPMPPSRPGSRTRLAGWAWCGANWLVKLVTLALLLAAVTGVPVDAALCGAWAGELAAVLPVQPPAGFGSHEAAVAFAMLPWVDAALPQLLAAAFAVHLFSLVVAVATAAAAWWLAPASRRAASWDPIA